jgi:hypothetical protein
MLNITANSSFNDLHERNMGQKWMKKKILRLLQGCSLLSQTFSKYMEIWQSRWLGE